MVSGLLVYERGVVTADDHAQQHGHIREQEQVVLFKVFPYVACYVIQYAQGMEI